MEELRGLRQADAAIVGGGLTGLLLGAALSQDGMRVAILEATESGGGPSAAIASLHSGSTFIRALEAHGVDVVRHYASSLQSQLNALLATPLPYVQSLPAYTYARTKADLPALERHRAVYTQLGLPMHAAPDAGGCPFPVELSLLSQGAVVDVCRWKAALQSSILRNGGRLYANSRVTGFDGGRICTAHGAVCAPIVILTTGKPLGMHDKRLLTLLESRTIAYCALSMDTPLHSIQQSLADRFTLCPTPTGAIASMPLGHCGTKRVSRGLTQFTGALRHLLPDCTQDTLHFSNDVVPADGLPFIGTMPASRMLFASGVNGVLGAMHAAEVLHRRVTGRALPEDAHYSPAREIPRQIVQQEARRMTAYRLDGLLHFRAPHCSHCSGKMRYFSPASLWECPCCGSCCTMLGEPLSGPGMASVDVSPRQRPWRN